MKICVLLLAGCAAVGAVGQVGAAAPGCQPPVPLSRAAWSWPLAGPGGGPPRVVRPFAPPVLRWLSGHRGVDLAGPIGAPVLAAGAGTVTYAGVLAGEGVVVIEHAGVRTSYEPVTARVRPGDWVARGAQIGVLAVDPGDAGRSGDAGGVLHWGLLTGHGHAVRYYDPLILLGFARLRLEPAV